MKRFLLSVWLIIFSASVWASGEFVISDVRVDGLQRVSAGTVFNALGLRAGDTASTESLALATKALFKTGYFKDIELLRDGNVLIVSVKEQPSVSSITIDGNRAIKTEDLKKGLAEAGLEEGQIFQQAVLERTALELERQYVAQGRYNAKVTTDVHEQENNRVDVTLTIKEGSESSVQQVNIVGNNEFSDADLLDQFELKPPEMLAWYKSALQYSKEKLNGDMERLRSYYMDRGYINFQITSTQVAISPDKEDIYITLNVSEGGQYKVGKLSVSGIFVVPEQELQDRILLKEGDVFSKQKVTNTTELMTLRMGNEGYTFANVNPIPTTNDEEHIVDLNFFVDPGKRAYVRQIEFKGNSKTNDEVLRREMRQFESAWASTDKIDRSKERMQRLPYIKSVNVETKPVPGTEDQIDVEYAVEEQPSGSLSASVGFSQSNGLILSSNITQENVLGTGNRLSIGATRSESTIGVSLGYLNPYFTDDGVSRGYDISFTRTDYNDEDLADYTNDRYAAGVTFGYPFSEIDRLNFGLGLMQNDLTVGGSPAVEIREYQETEGTDNGSFNGTIGWSRSTLNSGVFATRGERQSLTLRTTLPGSDVTFYKLEYNGQKLTPITEDLTMRLKLNTGYSDTLFSSQYTPFYENYYVGGLNSVRGFESGTIGPRDTFLTCNDLNNDNICGPGETFFETGDPFGGNAKLVGTIEFLFPVPFVKDQKSVQNYVFFDAGTAFNTMYTESMLEDFKADNGIAGPIPKDYEEGISAEYLRYSAGVGFDWLTSFGPISISLAQPIKKQKDDDSQVFQFSLGRTF